MKNYVYMTDKDNCITMIPPAKCRRSNRGRWRKNQSKPGYSCIPQNCDRRNKTGETVVNNGESIGTASCDIHIGDWVHTQNLESGRGRGDR